MRKALILVAAASVLAGCVFQAKMYRRMEVGHGPIDGVEVSVPLYDGLAKDK